jgi:hypothetical protein
MAVTYEEIVERLGKRAKIQLDSSRGSELRIAPTHLGLRQHPDKAAPNPDLEMRYRGKALVTFHADHTYTLRTNSMGKTALKRISEYSPLQVTTSGGSVCYLDPDTGEQKRFREGMRVDGKGRPVDGSSVRPNPATPNVPNDSASPKAVQAESFRNADTWTPEDLADAVGTAMRTNGASEVQIQRATRDVGAAFYRGRVPKPPKA